MVFALFLFSMIMMGASVLLADISDQRENYRNDIARLQSRWMAESEWNIATNYLEEMLKQEAERRIDSIGQMATEEGSENERIELDEPFLFSTWQHCSDESEGSAFCSVASETNNIADIQVCGKSGDYSYSITGKLFWEFHEDGTYKLILKNRGLMA